MVKEFALTRRAVAFAAAASLVVASIAPLLLGQMQVEAAQVTARKITMGSSKVGQTDVTYTVNFTTGTTSAIEGFVIDFCSDSPLVGATCTAPTGFSANQAGLAFTVAGTSGGAFAKSVGASADANTVVLTRTDVTSQTAPLAITITLGGAGGADGITNPTTEGTFYARILTYATSAGADAYTPGTPGTHVDDGGIALSTADQLTINARVQEQLEFCVASIPNTIVDDASTPANCTHAVFTGAGNDNTVDLGVIDSGAASISPVSAATGGDSQNGGIMIRTNAVSGAVVSYYAEQNTSSGSLKVAGAACGATTTSPLGSTTDQCFNSANDNVAGTQTSFAVGNAGEKFGMTASAVYRPTGSTTTNLTRSTDYDGDGTAAGGFEWVDTGAGTATTLASSSTVLDYEMLVLNFAARAAATTPTGSYAVTSTYIATSTF